MADLNWIQAWEQWRTGAQLSNATLWGLSILWLGRAGKIAEFIGGATVILEIIGPDRIREASTYLLALITVKDIRARLANVSGWLHHFYFPHDRAAAVRERKITWQEIRGEPLLYLSTLLSLITVTFAWIYSPIATWWLNLLLAFILIYVLQLLIAPVIAAVSSFLILCITGLLALIIIKPLAWVLALPTLNTAVKIIAFLCLTIGFHFDLMSS
ncbi:MAG: hypothetical protein JWM78_846 [Verrucomicrobiaceae bacterium]|nr:hypothetical protein [Verrucomicrobiaceae bacterium]